MSEAYAQDRWRMISVILTVCMVSALCGPALAGTPGSVRENRPAALRIVGDDHRPADRTVLAASSGPGTAAPELLWKFAVFWDYQFYGKTAIPAIDGGYLIAGESRMNGTEESAQGAAIVLNEPSGGTTTW